MSDEKLKLFKSQFHKNELIHLNNAGLQLISKPAFDKINYWSKRFYEEGFNTDADYIKDVTHSRQSLASMIGCQASEVAFFTSAAGAITQLAFSAGLKADDEVLMWDQEYGSHLYPWKTACDQVSAKLVLVESEKNLATPVDKYIKAITPKTKVLAFSWVQFMNGSRMDHLPELIKLAHEKNILVFVDIIQGFGFHKCDLWQHGVDAVVGGSHKWLVSPVGVGFLALRENLIPRFKPHVIGAYTYGTCDDPADLFCSPKKDATKFEPGSKQVLEITALGASIDFIQQVGVKTIETEGLRLAKILRQGVKDLGHTVVSCFDGDKENSNPFINFIPRNKSIKEVSSYLNKYQVFHAIRGPGLRFTTQAFNTDDEVFQALDVLKSV